jgi:hypothetical protein
MAAETASEQAAQACRGRAGQQDSADCLGETGRGSEQSLAIGWKARLTGLSARNLEDPGPVQAAQASIERIRHLLWHGRQDQADQEIAVLLGHGSKIVERNGASVQESTNDLTRLCKELKGYVQNHRDAIINYHRRYHRQQPVSSSRAEGCVEEIANARMGKKQRMRWSPRGAHRVALVRAAVLDGRLKPCEAIPMAA